MNYVKNKIREIKTFKHKLLKMHACYCPYTPSNVLSILFFTFPCVGGGVGLWQKMAPNKASGLFLRLASAAPENTVGGEF